MLQGICTFLAVFACTIFSPKPFVARGFINFAGYMQISTLLKISVLLKPCIYGHWAAYQIGVVQQQAMQQIVSFLGSNAMDMGALVFCQYCKTAHLFGCRKLYHFCTILYTGLS